MSYAPAIFEQPIEGIIAATREPNDMPKAEAADACATLLLQAGNLALDKLKEPDVDTTTRFKTPGGFVTLE